ncbi:MAG: YncE family protein [Myxococcales bacterium]|nr:YncE family protein [Myxococcales bacterium]
MRHLLLLLLPLTGLLAACADPEVVHTYAAYTGDAFPRLGKSLNLPLGEIGFTSDTGSDTLTVLALPSATVIAQRPIGREPVDLDGPHHLAVDLAAGAVYVALSYPVATVGAGPHAAHGSSLSDGFLQKRALDDLRPLGEVRLDKNPGDIVRSQDGKRLVVTHFNIAQANKPGASLQDRRGRMAVVDPAQLLPTGSPEPRWVTVCVAPHGVVLSPPDGRFAYVACFGEDAVAIVDLAPAKATIAYVALGAAAVSQGPPSYGPYSLALAGSRLAVASTESKDVRVLDTATQTMRVGIAKTVGSPYFPAFSPDATRLWVPTQAPDALVEIDADTGLVLRTQALGAACVKPHEVVATPDGSRLYVVCEGDHVGPGRVLVLDAASLKATASTEVGVYPDRLVVVYK